MIYGEGGVVGINRGEWWINSKGLMVEVIDFIKSYPAENEVILVQSKGGRIFVCTPGFFIGNFRRSDEIQNPK